MRKFFAAFLFMSLIISPSFAYDAIPGDVIVVLRNTSGVRISSANSAMSVENLSAVKSFAQSANVNVVKTYDALSEVSNNIFMLVHSDKKNENDLLREIKQNPNVIAASLNRVIHLCADERIPNDPEYYRLWGMEAINAPAVWNMSTGSEDVYVAVIDSGVDFEHEDLKDNFSREYSRNFVGMDTSGYDPNNYGDANDHGTHVSGTIAAVGNNGVGVAGVNWKAKIISLRVFDASGRSTNAAFVTAINYLTDLLVKNPGLNVAAVNMSIGGYSPLSPSEAIAANDPQYLALQALSRLNRTVICVAAGNENTEVGAPVMNTTYLSGSISNRKGSYCYPAGYPGIENMIVVAASGYTLQRASYSNYSSHYVHVAAPGGAVDSQNLSRPINGWIYSTIRAHDSDNSPIYERELIKLEDSKRTSFYGDLLGTSMATPHVTGAVALLKSIFPSATPSQIKAAILGGANGDYLRDDNTSMYGFLDIRGAVDFLAASLGENNPPKISAHELHNATANQFYKFELKASGSEPITWSVEGNLPEGLSLDKNGNITGVTEKEGVYEFVITAENDYGYDSMIYTVSVDKGIAPVISMDSDINNSMTSTAYSFPVNISAGSWPVIYSIESSDMPSGFGLSIDKMGCVNFKPTKEGTYHLTLKAQNYAGEDSKSLTVTVKAQKIPTIESNDLSSGIKGVRYPIKNGFEYNTLALGSPLGNTITAEGAVPMSWDITGLPEGLDYGKTTVYDKNGYSHKETVTIGGHAKEAGSFDVHVTVSNKFGTASRDFMISIADLPPSFMSSSENKSMQKGYYTTSTTWAIGSSPITFTVEGTLPKGIAVKSNDNFAFFYGTPTETGTFNATVYASNNLGTASRDLTVIVREPAVITTNFLPDAVRGVSYNARLASFAGVALSWTLSSDLPAGLTLSESGDISGIPTQAGKFLITIDAKALDSSTNHHTRSYTLTVRDRPAIITSSLPNGTMNTPYSRVTLSADGTAPITWSVSSGDFPAGLTLAGNGYIFGTPTKSGAFAFTLRAANGVLYGEKSFTVNITSDGSESHDVKPDSHDVKPDSGDVTPVKPDSHDVKPATITTGSARGISSLTLGESEAIISEGGLIGAVLPEISVSVSDFYTYNSVDIFANIKLSDDVPAGYTLKWHPFTRTVTGALIEDSANESESGEFCDSEGNVITDVPADKIVNVSSWLEAGKVYYPVISAVSKTQSSNTGVSSSSGGCNFGIAGLVILGMLAAKIYSRKRQH